MRSVVGLITNQKQQQNTATSGQSQSNVLHSEALWYLAEEAVDGESDDEEQVQVDEGERVAVGDAGVARDLAQAQPESSVRGHFLGWSDVAKSLQF